MTKGKDVKLICTMVWDRVKELIKTHSPVEKAAVDARYALIEDEFDVFVRNGNRTDYRRDDEAASSAAIEPLSDKPGKYALTYSTMKGRRVDDILFAILDFLSIGVFPPVEREDKNTTGPNAGKPKLSHRRKERDQWIAALGYRAALVNAPLTEGGLGFTDGQHKGKRAVFGDQFAELKAKLESLIPERFEGTLKPTLTNFQNLPLTIPATLSTGMTGSIYLPVARPQVEDVSLITKSTQRLRAFLLAGFSIPTSKDGKMSEIGAYYTEKVNLLDANLQAEAKSAERKAKRVSKPKASKVAEPQVEEHIEEAAVAQQEAEIAQAMEATA